MCYNKDLEDMKVLTNLLQQMQQPNMLHSRHSVDGSLLGKNLSNNSGNTNNNPLNQDSLFKDSFIYNYSNKINENAPSDHSPNTVSTNTCATKAPVSTSNRDSLSTPDNHISNHHLHHQLQVIVFKLF